MALNHGKLMQDLERLSSQPDTDQFIFDFLRAYQTPNATLTRLMQGGDRNVGERPGDVGVRQKLYFRPVTEDPYTTAVALLDEEVISRHKIRFVIVTDFKDLVAYDLGVGDRMECAFRDLSLHYSFFLPLAGYEKAVEYSDSPADVKAAEKMGRLCDLLRQSNEMGAPGRVHELNVFLTRLLFCLFAEDTGIFEENQFTTAVQGNTHKDGSDAHQVLRQIFLAMNTERRPRDLPAHLAAFPYVNGGLFRDDLPVPVMGARARRMLLDAGQLDWSTINPDIFGSMFQSVIDPEQRGNLGQHYTSLSNIMKVLRPLFLDKLEDALDKAKGKPKQLEKLLQRIRDIKVFDPACGSGNFLIIAFKELRKLEMQVLEALNDSTKQNILVMPGVQIQNFYGIETDDFAHEIALLALWLSEHQMNMAFLDKFGHYEPTLPLKASGNIELGNALSLDWTRICPRRPHEEVYVCGNPPFNGANSRTPEQNESMAQVFKGFRTFKYLDFVACWFWKGAQYIAGTQAEMGLVATNSICQGMQTSMLWPPILEKDLSIHFAYQGFQWKNSARDNAGVHVAIIGLSNNATTKSLYKKVDGDWHKETVSNISPYLLEGTDIVVKDRASPLIKSTRMEHGNKPVDGGNLLLTLGEKEKLLHAEPNAGKWLKRLLGAEEFIKNKERWCLWLKDATEADIDSMPAVRSRVERVREARSASRDAGARQLALRPHQFRDLNNPDSFLLVPCVTSERREYAPIGFFGSDIIATNLVNTVAGGTLYDFGVLSTRIHMDWLHLVGGRLKSDFRYSAKLVYNTFPWPDYNAKQRAEIEALADEVLLVREDTFDWTMAEMYDPDKMPPALREAHRNLDEALERLYRRTPFRDQAERQEFLLARYEKLIKQEAGVAV
ncbi:methyltransferase [Marinobacter psychrophilus]|uniref:site-specific DNA-methyltransferase (adenine-specific) n=2 Tax=Marinobacter psychrophilus TaxID=330734 RepID=A0A0H4I1A6_9GAMM|nr:methyltransferase [Marinobacter psychrophilus]